MKLIWILAFTALVTLPAPTIASASSPILSGYGGPGAGDQVIIGATLLNGNGDGSGAGGGGTAVSSPVLPSRTVPSEGSSRPQARAVKHAPKRTPGRSSPAPKTPAQTLVERGMGISGGNALGLSGEDLLLLLLSIAGLGFIALTTRRLAGPAR